MIKVFPGKVLIRQDLAIEKKNGLIVISKGKTKRNFGKVIDGDEFKKDDHVLFFAQKGIIMEGKCLIEEKDVCLILKKRGMIELKGNRIIVEAEKESAKLSGDLVKSDAHIEILPMGTILEIGKLVTEFKKGDRVLYDLPRALFLTPYPIYLLFCNGIKKHKY
jgi:co-chaperonin GroES (HSP10)